MANDFIKIDSETKKRCEAIAKGQKIQLNEYIKKALKRSFLLDDLDKVKQSAHRVIKTLTNNLQNFTNEEIIEHSNEVVRQIVKCVASDVLIAHENLILSLQVPDAFDEEYIKALENELYSDSGEKTFKVNVEDPKFRNDYQHWKESDKTKKGFEALIEKHSTENLIIRV